MKVIVALFIAASHTVLCFDFTLGVENPYGLQARVRISRDDIGNISTNGLNAEALESRKNAAKKLNSGRKFVPGYTYDKASVPSRSIAGQANGSNLDGQYIPQRQEAYLEHEPYLPPPVLYQSSYRKPIATPYSPKYTRQVILDRVFSNDRPILDPKQKDEDLQWDNLNPTHPLDNPDIDPNLYFNNAHTKQEKDHWKAVTIPHRVTNSNSKTVGSGEKEINVGLFDKYEASMSSDPVSINYGDRVTTRVRMSAETVGTENHPFPKNLVVDDQDDQRLGAVGAALASLDPVSLQAGWVITNKGLWVIYFVGGDASDPSIQAFVQTKRIAKRVSKQAIHNLGVEYDQQYNKFILLLEGKPVWAVENVGLPSADPYAVTILRSKGNRTRVVRPNSVELNIGSYTYLRSTDPNNKYSDTVLVGLAASNFELAEDLNVYDEESFLMNRVWGQGSVFRLYDLEVAKLYPKSSYGRAVPYAQVPYARKEETD